jgi:hypothetical protein
LNMSKKRKRIRVGRILLTAAAIMGILVGIPLLAAWIVVAQPLLSANSPSDATVDEARLRQHVTTLSETFHPRSYRNTENLDRCAEYIRREFDRTGARTSEQVFVARERTYRNVIATFGAGTNRIVVGAHYDAVRNTPGADDNASGVAMLIELASLIANADLECEVELVAYTLEEPPFFGTANMGSAHHAQMLSDSNVHVRIMIALDMVGYFSDEKGSQHCPGQLFRMFYPDTGDFIAIIGTLDQRKPVRDVKKFMKGSADLPVYSINAPIDIQGIDHSDHRNYWAHGYDAVLISDTADYRNEMYHGPGDTADRLDYARMAKVTIQVYEAVSGIAGR